MTLYLTFFFLFASGTTDFSFIDPVVIGRNLFGVINETVSGITGYIQDTLCAILDSVLDVFKGNTFFLLSFFHINSNQMNMEPICWHWVKKINARPQDKYCSQV